MNKSFFYHTPDQREIIDFCKTAWPEEVREVIHRADLATKQTFIFTHRWDMERCEIPVTFDNKIDWTYRFKGDFEWTVNLNRSRFMSELGQAYWLTSDEKYVTSFINLLKDWINQNPLSIDEILSSKEQHYNVKDTWRKLDSGIRITNWLKGYHCVRESDYWTREDEQLFKEAVHLHGTYLKFAFTPHDRQSNWGFLETNGLFQIAMLFPEFAESKSWLSIAVDRLVNMCELQIFEDGMHNEQSPMYHHEVLHCLFECVWLAKKNEHPLPSICEDSLKRLFLSSLAFVKPTGSQPMISDSDDTDIRDILCRGAVLFKRGDLKHQAYDQLDYESAWYYGKEGIDEFHKLVAHPPSTTSIHLSESGYSIMRSGWSESSHYCLFDGGHMDIIQAHGHDDFLHLDLNVFGKDLLIDTGRYTYMEGEERRYFKESFQHNTTIVDHTSISEFKDSWTWGDIARTTQSFWKTCESFDYAEAGHDGYRNLKDPVGVLRKILFVKPYYWLVIDEFQSNETHHFAQHFHVSENVSVQTYPDRSVAVCNLNEKEGLFIHSITPAKLTKDKCWISRNYNEKHASSKLVFDHKATGKTRMITGLIPFHSTVTEDVVIKEIGVRNTFGDYFSNEDVTAMEINIGMDTHWVVVSHSGPNSFQFAEHHMTGDVLLVKKKGDQLNKWVIKV
ncbi:heparinase [Pontibacillus chungwhensis BH030062]|uniref:Heparinase n=1 Tax=Pontibacillus chungwhensis BH030062 TaxID=1385513 RepID=A0A0A2UYJ1_9BACI|nr:alginate lyase family protein [Pontibacillus chungwhensis]KGP92994.1 heparinase [Pontibacillus chungwhensis BH030062]